MSRRTRVTHPLPKQRTMNALVASSETSWCGPALWKKRRGLKDDNPQGTWIGISHLVRCHPTLNKLVMQSLGFSNNLGFDLSDQPRRTKMVGLQDKVPRAIESLPQEHARGQTTSIRLSVARWRALSNNMSFSPLTSNETRWCTTILRDSLTNAGSHL